VPLKHPQMRRVVHGIAFGRNPIERLAQAGVAGALQTLQRTHARWWDQRNVVGLCFAPKVRRGRVEDVTLQVHVLRKKAHTKIPRERRIPPFIRAEGVKLWTDVREIGRARLDVLVSPDRPAHPGFNIGHRSTGSGTLTCAVRSRVTGERLGLSCGHVIARHGLAAEGERVLVPSLSEALSNGWLASASFGALVAVGPIRFAYDDAARNVDAATVRPDNPTALERTLALLGVAPNDVREAAAIGTPVRKVGYATELTTGVVQAVHWVVSLPFPTSCGTVRSVWFSDQIGISSFASAGDSGALVLDDKAAALGMHVGSYAGLSVCAPMQRVLDALGCDLI
jgi:hypothetical protein